MAETKERPSRYRTMPVVRWTIQQNHEREGGSMTQYDKCMLACGMLAAGRCGCGNDPKNCEVLRFSEIARLIAGRPEDPEPVPDNAAELEGF